MLRARDGEGWRGGVGWDGGVEGWRGGALGCARRLPAHAPLLQVIQRLDLGADLAARLVRRHLASSVRVPPKMAKAMAVKAQQREGGGTPARLREWEATMRMPTCGRGCGKGVWRCGVANICWICCDSLPCQKTIFCVGSFLHRRPILQPSHLAAQPDIVLLRCSRRERPPVLVSRA